MSNFKKRSQLDTEMNMKVIDRRAYGIHGLPKKSQPVQFLADQVLIDNSSYTFVSVSGDTVQDIIEDIDIYLSTVVSGDLTTIINDLDQLRQDAVLRSGEQVVSGTKYWLDNQVFESGLLPSGAGPVMIGASGSEFDEIWADRLYADELIMSGSPGIAIRRTGSMGVIDTTDDNDIEMRRDGAQYLRLSQSGVEVNQDVFISNNLTVQGDTTTLNTETLLVEDNIIELNYGHAGPPVLDTGLHINRGSSTDALFLWDEFNDYFVAGLSGSLDKVTLNADLLAASGTLQADIDTRALYSELVATSGVLQSDINTRALYSELVATSGVLQSDINTRALYSELVATSGVLQTQIDTKIGNPELLAASGTLQADINTRVLRAGDTMTGDLVLPAVSPPTANSASRRQYVDDGLALKLSLTGGNMTGQITTSLDPVSPLDMSRKNYVDARDNTRLPLAGGTLTGDVNADSTSVDLGASSRFGRIYAALFANAGGDVTLQAGDDVIIDANGANGDIFFRTNGTGRWQITRNSATGFEGDFIPLSDGEYNIGSSSNAVGTTYTRNLTADTNLQLGRGNGFQWTIDSGGNFVPIGGRTVGSAGVNVTTFHGSNLTAANNLVVSSTAGTVTVTQSNANNMSFRNTNSAGTMFLGMGTAANYAVGPFIQMNGSTNASPGNAGDLRIGAGTGELQFFVGNIGGINAIRWQIDQNGTLSNQNTQVNVTKVRIYASDGSFGSAVQQILAGQGPTNGFEFLQTRASSNDAGTTGDPQHIFHGNGDLLIDGTLFQGVPDYAEYFEVEDGESSIPAGTSVVLVNDRIRAYNPGTDDTSDIIGVVRKTGTASAINHPLNWPGKYEKDDFGDYVLDGNGQRIITPEYDPNQEYIWRSERDEWHVIGLVGRVEILKSSGKHPSWKKMKDISATVELWLIK